MPPAIAATGPGFLCSGAGRMFVRVCGRNKIFARLQSTLMKTSRVDFHSLVNTLKTFNYAKETESSWSIVNTNLNLLRDEISTAQDAALVLSTLGPVLQSSMLSDRSRLSGTALLLLKCCIEMGIDMDRHAYFLQSLFKLVNRPLKVFSQRAEDVLVLLCRHINIERNALLFRETFRSANKTVRLAVVKVVKGSSHPELKMVVERAKTDPSVEVRNEAKECTSRAEGGAGPEASAVSARGLSSAFLLQNGGHRERSRAQRGAADAVPRAVPGAAVDRGRRARESENTRNGTSMPGKGTDAAGRGAGTRREVFRGRDVSGVPSKSGDNLTPQTLSRYLRSYKENILNREAERTLLNKIRRRDEVMRELAAYRQMNGTKCRDGEGQPCAWKKWELRNRQGAEDMRAGVSSQGPGPDGGEKGADCNTHGHKLDDGSMGGKGADCTVPMSPNLKRIRDILSAAAGTRTAGEADAEKGAACGKGHSESAVPAAEGKEISGNDEAGRSGGTNAAKGCGEHEQDIRVGTEHIHAAEDRERSEHGSAGRFAAIDGLTLPAAGEEHAAGRTAASGNTGTRSSFGTGGHAVDGSSAGDSFVTFLRKTGDLMAENLHEDVASGTVPMGGSTWKDAGRLSDGGIVSRQLSGSGVSPNEMVEDNKTFACAETHPGGACSEHDSGGMPRQFPEEIGNQLPLCSSGGACDTPLYSNAPAGGGQPHEEGAVCGESCAEAPQHPGTVLGKPESGATSNCGEKDCGLDLGSELSCDISRLSINEGDSTICRSDNRPEPPQAEGVGEAQSDEVENCRKEAVADFGGRTGDVAAFQACEDDVESTVVLEASPAESIGSSTEFTEIDSVVYVNRKTMSRK